jgi:hypothetical protein
MVTKSKRTPAERINVHEAECAQRYKNIEFRLEAGAAKFEKLERLLWGVYPFILVLFIVQNFGG